MPPGAGQGSPVSKRRAPASPTRSSRRASSSMARSSSRPWERAPPSFGVDTASCLNVAILLSTRFEASSRPGARRLRDRLRGHPGGLVFVVGLLDPREPPARRGWPGEAGSPSIQHAPRRLCAALPDGGEPRRRLARRAAWTRYSSFAGIGAILALFRLCEPRDPLSLPGARRSISCQRFEQGELYAYSAASAQHRHLQLLAFGLTGAGSARAAARLRLLRLLAAVRKVFLIGSSPGSRASCPRRSRFVGLGAVLIGIGLASTRNSCSGAAAEAPTRAWLVNASFVLESQARKLATTGCACLRGQAA